MANVWPIAV